MSNEQLHVLNAVLGMEVGDVRALRERHISPSTIHRYRDGWYIFINFSDAHDRQIAGSRCLGWFFNQHEDLADLITDNLGGRHVNFILTGTGQ